jgi:hypothetical protein
MTSPKSALAQAVASAVSAVPGVARLASGPLVETATYFPGGKVAGIRIGDQVEIHLVASVLPLPPLIEKVTATATGVLATHGDSRPVRVIVEDLDDSLLTKR